MAKALLILQTEPVFMGWKTEISPDHHLDREPKELDIHICRLQSVPANTTAVRNGLAIMQAGIAAYMQW